MQWKGGRDENKYKGETKMKAVYSLLVLATMFLGLNAMADKFDQRSQTALGVIGGPVRPLPGPISPIRPVPNFVRVPFR
jgi:hypothetical protein